MNGDVGGDEWDKERLCAERFRMDHLDRQVNKELYYTDKGRVK